MNYEEILELAKECGLYEAREFIFAHEQANLEAFYRAAYNKAIEDAAKECINHMEIFPDFGEYCKGGIAGLESVAKAIRALEMKP